METLNAIKNALQSAGIPCEVEHTGGGCYALFVRGSGKLELATDGDSLSANPVWDGQSIPDCDEAVHLLDLEDCQRGGVALIVETIKANLWRAGL